jgi:hypothetical protein
MRSRYVAEQMRAAAAILAQDARENQAGVDVISVGPVYGEHTAWAECSVRQQSESRVVNNLSDTVIISKDSHGHSYKLRF